MGLGVGGCSGDIFHSTAWSSLCEADAEAEGCGGGSGEGGFGGSGPGPGPQSSSSSSSSGEGGSGEGGSGGDVPSCGDGNLDAGEACDDANTKAGDGCSASCEKECAGSGEHLFAPGGRCYLEVLEPKLAWDDARAACQAWGGDLAAIASQEEQSFLETFVTQRGWIGLTDRASEGNFVWANGEPVTFTKWREGEPSNSNGVEHCVEFYPPNLLFTWNDVNCALTIPYLCEKSLD